MSSADLETRDRKVLVVDDDTTMARLLQMALRGQGYQTLSATCGREALQRVYEHRPDLVVLDVMMPDMNGCEVCRRIRDLSSVPILMLTARSSEDDQIKGFDSGADDYVVKPFAIKSLLARIQALLRRAQNLAGEGGRMNTRLVCGNVQVDLIYRKVTVGGRQVKLTPTEFRLLTCLMQRPGETLTRRELLTRVWGPEYTDETEYLKLYIGYLRRKIEADPHNPALILSERGVGYYMVAPDPALPLGAAVG